MQDLKISVIVPAYNNALWLPRCLDSILAQTYRNLEVIVINDGSRDNTKKIMEAYAQKDVRVRIIHQENGGVTSARLAGVKAATGAWIGFVDGDDAIDPDMYQRLLDNAQNFHAEISHCGYRMVFDDGRINYFHNTGKLLQHDRNTALKELLSGAIIEPGLCNKLFRADLFSKILVSPAMDTNIRINEDLLMNFILFSQTGKTVFEDFCPYQYIVRSNSASRQKLNRNRIYDPILVKELILSIAPEGVQQAAQAAYLSTCINVYNSLVLAHQPTYQTDKAVIRKRISSHSQWLHLINKKQQLLAEMIRYIPWAYQIIYEFYATYLQKNPYN